MDTRFGFPRWRSAPIAPLSFAVPSRLAPGPSIHHVSDDLELRLAQTRSDIRAAQALRFRVFHNEMGAAMRGRGLWLRRDIDRFDRYCDHLLVIDRSAPGRWLKVVGTYRLMRGEVALAHRGFYTASEFDLGKLMRQAPGILELGRSCVEPPYRSRGVMQLLWKGIADYLMHYDLKLMLGCASFPGTDPDAVAHALSFLHREHLMPQAERPCALPHRYVEMDRVPGGDLDPDLVRRQMPPLVKGYLRLGGRVGDGAVVDKAFNTIDVCLVLPVEAVKARYVKHYIRDNDQAAA